MTPLQAIAVAAMGIIRGSGNKLTMKTVQAWITQHGNRDNYSRGYSGNSLSRGPSHGFVEVVKQPGTGSGFTVRAEVYLDPKQGSVASKTWEASKLDGDLEKFFGKNLRVRMNI